MTRGEEFDKSMKLAMKGDFSLHDEIIHQDYESINQGITINKEMSKTILSGVGDFTIIGPMYTIYENDEFACIHQYSKIANDGIKENELKKAKAQISSDISFSRDGSYAIAGALNEALAIGDWKFYTNFIDNINNVSAKHVQSIVKKYLVEDQSTIGWFIPKK